MAEKIEIEVVLSSKNEKKTFDKIEKESGKAGKRASKNFEKNFKVDTSSITKNILKTTFAVVALNKALTALGQSLDNLRQFSRGIAEINSILPKNQKLTEEATQRLVRFSSTFATGAQTQAKAFYNIVSAGVKGTAKQLRTLEVANKAAVAGLVGIDESAKVIVSSVNAYSKAGLTATQASDALFVAVREGVTTFQELSDFLGNTTAVAANAGLEFTELTGTLAFLTKNGLKTDIAVTGIRQVMVSLIKPTKEANEEAKRIGLEFNTAALRTKGFAGFLADLREKTKGNEGSLAKLFGNVRALTPILQVANGDFKEFNRILDETAKSTGATTDAFGEIKKNLDFDISRSTQEWKAFGLNLINLVSPVVLEISRALGNVGRVFNSAFDKIGATDLTKVNNELSTTADSINMLQSDLKKFKALPQKTLFGGISTSGKAVVRITNQVERLRIKRQELLRTRADILEKRKQQDKEAVKSDASKNGKILESNKQLLKELGVIGLSRFEQLQAQRDRNIAVISKAADARVITATQAQERIAEVERQFSAQRTAILNSTYSNELSKLNEQEAAKLELLRSAREANEIDELEYLSRKGAVEEEFNTKRQEARDQEVLNSKVGFESVSESFRIHASKMKMTAGQLGKTMLDLSIRGFGTAFKNIGAALANGENAQQAFADATKAMLADAASALGDYYILEGAGRLAKSYGADATGYQMLAAGAGFKILSGALGAGGGTGATSASGSSSAGGGSDSGADDTIDEQRDVAQERTGVQLNVQGSIFNTSETAKDLTNLLNDNFEGTGAVLTGATLA